MNALRVACGVGNFPAAAEELNSFLATIDNGNMVGPEESSSLGLGMLMQVAHAHPHGYVLCRGFKRRLHNLRLTPGEEREQAILTRMGFAAPQTHC